MRTVQLLTLSLALLQGSIVRADASEDARHHFEEATKLFNVGEFDHAAGEYREAYKAKPDPAFLYNIGQSYRLANNLQQAIFFYRSYLRNAPHAPNRREVEDRIRKLETQIALTSQPPNAPAAPGSVGSVPATTTPPQQERPAAAPPPTGTPAPPPAAVTPPEATTPPAPAAGSAELTTTTAPTPSERQPLYKKWWLWAAVGGGVVVGVALGVGLGVGLHGSSAPSSHFGTTVVF